MSLSHYKICCLSENRSCMSADRSDVFSDNNDDIDHLPKTERIKINSDINKFLLYQKLSEYIRWIVISKKQIMKSTECLLICEPICWFNTVDSIRYKTLTLNFKLS